MRPDRINGPMARGPGIRRTDGLNGRIILRVRRARRKRRALRTLRMIPALGIAAFPAGTRPDPWRPPTTDSLQRNKKASPTGEAFITAYVKAG
jgi:hypothetical protein